MSNRGYGLVGAMAWVLTIALLILLFVGSAALFGLWLNIVMRFMR